MPLDLNLDDIDFRKLPLWDEMEVYGYEYPDDEASEEAFLALVNSDLTDIGTSRVKIGEQYYLAMAGPEESLKAAKDYLENAGLLGEEWVKDFHLMKDRFKNLRFRKMAEEVLKEEEFPMGKNIVTHYGGKYKINFNGSIDKYKEKNAE